ncbi:MAG TPA: 4-alpha-glucanotransferase [Planctomycetes bacterium]|nr:4-alpha-glucanotransferase [Planctomycetota bacterium]HIJ71230.1 4-alpha-glucanotransferase [Planctomycetota bacterium]
MKCRSSGILCHITSLPSRFGVGDLGPGAYKFADFLASAGQSCWQVLPLNPPAIQSPHSPYSCLSAFAGSGLLISPELLYRQGLLTRSQIRDIPAFNPNKANFRQTIRHKTGLLKAAYEHFKSKPTDEQYRRFCRENASWLDDFAVYNALRHHLKTGWWCDWPAHFKDKDKFESGSLNAELQDAIEAEKFIQYTFFSQWFALKRYCKERGIGIIGDMPIYVSFDSADVWANPHFFKLTKHKRPCVVSGCPPDIFNKKGQLWGHPVYDWQELKKAGFSWWLGRMRHNLSLFDFVRIDHFRGLVAYWEVPAHHKTAAKGRWIRVPKEDFFAKLLDSFPARAIIIEDLGHITPAVKAFIEKLGLSGMKILIFGFGPDADSKVHAPENHVKNSVVYTGNHDTNTIRGWFEQEADQRQKKRLFDYLGSQVSASRLNWTLIELAAASVAKLAIIPLQDVLGLGAEARMNRPGTSDENNWTWRFNWHRITPRIVERLKEITQTHRRA